MQEYNTRDYPRGYVPKVQPYTAPFSPDGAYRTHRFEVILHPCGQMWLRCIGLGGYLIQGWVITLDKAAALERGEPVCLPDNTLTVKTFNKFEVVTTLPNTVANLIMTNWSR